MCSVAFVKPISAQSPPTILQQPVRVSGDVVHKWRERQIDLAWVRGQCRLEHEGKMYQANDVVLSIDGGGNDLIVGVLMAGVLVGDGSVSQKPIVARMRCTDVPTIASPKLTGERPLPPDWRTRLGLPLSRVSDDDPTGLSFIEEPQDRPGADGSVRPVQYNEPIPNASSLPPSGLAFPSPSAALPPPVSAPSVLANPPTEGAAEFLPTPIATTPSAVQGSTQIFVGGGTRSVDLLPRRPSSLPQIETVERAASGESVVVVRGGVTVLVRDVAFQLAGQERTELGTVTLSADRVVAWLPTFRDLLSGTNSFTDADGELYLEGDIVVRQGESVIYANAMYYNITKEMGVILDAEAVATVPQYQGTVRIKAEAMRQVAKGSFVASNAAVTSSRMGVPQYWLQSNQLQLSPRPIVIIDQETGQAITDSEPTITSGSNFVYLAGVPVFYWPRFTTPLRRPTFYLTGANAKNDDIFGTQVMLEWDIFQLLGFVNPPDGVESILLTDFLSERGPAVGTRTTYNRGSMFGIPGPVIGSYDSYLIDDDGTDVLGEGRRNLAPEETLRGRSTLRHRHYLPGGWEFIAELGYISDRNFLEQYFEQEWDQDADRNTGLRLRRYAGSQLIDASLNLQINDFFSETERLPVIDHHALGGSLLGDRLTWSMHNEIGYQRLNPADAPLDPAVAALTSTLPGETAAEGIVTRTRQELSAPLDAGPLRVVPFAIGEAAHYGEDVNGDELTRLWGGGGVRANLPLTRIDPTVQSSLLNIRGLAHKLDLSAEYFYADSDTDLDELPFYDPLDDNAQEEFRRAFTFSNFGAPPLPAEFDPRTVAFRQGVQRFVASPSDTIVDDLQQLRLGMKNRFQTKRGLPGRERIVDLFRFDVETILFMDADRDNFGETIGPTTYDAQYDLGDRVTLLSDGYIDFIDEGLRSISAGVRTSRPGLGDFYVGLLSLEGPISSTVLRASLDYRLNEKWIAEAGTTYDFGEVGAVGHSLALTRIGESFLFQLGARVDEGRDNTSFGFLVEPRFLPSPRLGRLGGQLIPPPGIEGLE
ncbi:MAG: organic solvent tolerance protein OstA [Planctomycetota bacterium]